MLTKVISLWRGIGLENDQYYSIGLTIEYAMQDLKIPLKPPQRLTVSFWPI